MVHAHVCRRACVNGEGKGMEMGAVSMLRVRRRVSVCVRGGCGGEDGQYGRRGEMDGAEGEGGGGGGGGGMVTLRTTQPSHAKTVQAEEVVRTLAKHCLSFRGPVLLLQVSLVIEERWVGRKPCTNTQCSACPMRRW